MALSIITLASLSSPRSLSDSNGKDALHFVNLQGMWFAIGIGVFFGVSKIDYKKYRKNTLSEFRAIRSPIPKSLITNKSLQQLLSK